MKNPLALDEAKALSEENAAPMGGTKIMILLRSRDSVPERSSRWGVDPQAAESCMCFQWAEEQAGSAVTVRI